MQIDQNLSNFSDIAVQTAFVVYCVALFLSLFYYGRMQGIIEGRRAVKSEAAKVLVGAGAGGVDKHSYACLLYTSPSPRDGLLSRMPSSA